MVERFGCLREFVERVKARRTSLLLFEQGDEIHGQLGCGLGLLSMAERERSHAPDCQQIEVDVRSTEACHCAQELAALLLAAKRRSKVPADRFLRPQEFPQTGAAPKLGEDGGEAEPGIGRGKSRGRLVGRRANIREPLLEHHLAEDTAGPHNGVGERAHCLPEATR